MNYLKIRLRDLVSSSFSIVDHVLVPSVPTEKWSVFVQKIRPVNNGYQLIRVGPASEGSYLLPDDLDGLALNISPGVGETWQFEKSLLKDFGIPSWMVDASVPKPPTLPNQMEFFDKFLVPHPTWDSGISISELIVKADEIYGSNSDLMLQMDIEGAEFECLLYVKRSDLLRFRIIAIEFHDMELWVQNSFFAKTLMPIFNKLLNDFDVVHSRANNHAHTFFYKGYFIPSALELTFHRKDRSKSYAGFRNLPSELDIFNSDFTSQKFPFQMK